MKILIVKITCRAAYNCNLKERRKLAQSLKGKIISRLESTAVIDYQADNRVFIIHTARLSGSRNSLLNAVETIRELILSFSEMDCTLDYIIEEIEDDTF